MFVVFVYSYLSCLGYFDRRCNRIQTEEYELQRNDESKLCEQALRKVHAIELIKGTISILALVQIAQQLAFSSGRCLNPPNFNKAICIRYNAPPPHKFSRKSLFLKLLESGLNKKKKRI